MCKGIDGNGRVWKMVPLLWKLQSVGTWARMKPPDLLANPDLFKNKVKRKLLCLGLQHKSPLCFLYCPNLNCGCAYELCSFYRLMDICDLCHVYLDPELFPNKPRELFKKAEKHLLLIFDRGRKSLPVSMVNHSRTSILNLCLNEESQDWASLFIFSKPRAIIATDRKGVGFVCINASSPDSNTFNPFCGYRFDSNVVVMVYSPSWSSFLSLF